MDNCGWDIGLDGLLRKWLLVAGFELESVYESD